MRETLIPIGQCASYVMAKTNNGRLATSFCMRPSVLHSLLNFAQAWIVILVISYFFGRINQVA